MLQCTWMVINMKKNFDVIRRLLQLSLSVMCWMLLESISYICFRLQINFYCRVFWCSDDNEWFDWKWGSVGLACLCRCVVTLISETLGAGYWWGGQTFVVTLISDNFGDRHYWGAKTFVITLIGDYFGAGHWWGAQTFVATPISDYFGDSLRSKHVHVYRGKNLWRSTCFMTTTNFA